MLTQYLSRHVHGSIPGAAVTLMFFLGLSHDLGLFVDDDGAWLQAVTYSGRHDHC